MKRILCCIGIHDWRRTNYSYHVANRMHGDIVVSEIRYHEFRCARCKTHKLKYFGELPRGR